MYVIIVAKKKQFIFILNKLLYNYTFYEIKSIIYSVVNYN